MLLCGRAIARVMCYQRYAMNAITPQTFELGALTRHPCKAGSPEVPATGPPTTGAAPPGPPAVRPAIDPDTLRRVLPPYSVLLHDDDVNDMDYVVHSVVVCVPEIDVEQAIAIMLEAHLNGQAHVITCPLERAELYRDRLESRGLTATIEKG
jgi:ATP-dependent Clp protease adaptor protein ClpS